MIICGIVCEYNPFHLGHAWHISEVRRILGEDTAIVCVMSGDFTQRGEAALYPKHARARAALNGGADLVLELPLPWSLASAEGFASGAVSLLHSLGCVTHLSFGSESADQERLNAAASVLRRPETATLIRAKIAEGVSYAAARQIALEETDSRLIGLLNSPNDILGIEYLKALESLNAVMELVVIRRKGSGHDDSTCAEMPSASFLRDRIRNGESAAQWMPSGEEAIYQQGGGASDFARMETAILSRLRFIDEAVFAETPDAGKEGLHRRIYQAVRTGRTLQEIEDQAVTKRYPRARIRRICLCAALNVKKQDAEGLPPYLRILAADKRGLSVLKMCAESCRVPIITKPASAALLDEKAGRIFALTAGAADLFHLGMQCCDARTGDSDWTTSPYIAK